MRTQQLPGQWRRRRTVPENRAKRHALHALTPRCVLLLGAAVFALVWADGVEGQILHRSSERADARPVTVGLPDLTGGFTFCRLHYHRTRRLRSGLGWSTDYPGADHNFMTRLEELTTTSVSTWSGGMPGYAAVQATDRDLFQCPFLFMSDPGSYDFTPDEVEQLREYFLKGGFLWADDLWNDMGAWGHLQRNLRRILPDHRIHDVAEQLCEFGFGYGHFVGWSKVF